MKVFERDRDGKLREVDPTAKKGRRWSLVTMQAEILFTAEEEKVRDEEDAANAAKQVAREKEAAEQAIVADQRRAEAMAKLEKLGLTADDIKAIFG